MVSLLVYGVIFIVVILILLAISFTGGDNKITLNSFYTKKETLEILKINEGALKNMIAEGMLRSYKKQDNVVFKKEDIDELRNKNI